MESRMNYRGLAEIVGLGIAAVLITAVSLFEAIKTGSIPLPFQVAIATLCTTLIARGVKGAQDRGPAVEKMDAAAKVAAQIAEEVRGVLEAHGSANKTVLASLEAVAQVAQAVAATPAPAPQPTAPASPGQKISG